MTATPDANITVAGRSGAAHLAGSDDAGDLDVAACHELLPMARRVAGADDTALLRIQALGGIVSGFAVLPSGALVGRRLVGHTAVDVDVTVLAADFVSWADGAHAASEVEAGGEAARGGIARRHDGNWRRGLPPVRGWTVLDTVPEAVVRELVAGGIAVHRDAQQLALGARAAEDLLDLAVLTVSGSAGATAQVTNRSLAAVTSMGFLPPGGSISVAVAGRWTRIAAAFGSVWAENASAGLLML